MVGSMKPNGKGQSEINAAASRVRAGTEPPKSRPGGDKGTGSDVGNERKADMSGALYGKPTDKNPLHGAIKELGAQHPYRYDDHDPHHNDSSHIRHKPMKLS